MPHVEVEKNLLTGSWEFVIVEVRKGTGRMDTMFGFDNAGSPVTRRVKFYEVEFADGYSIAIKGLARPTLEAASRFCAKEVAKCGPAVAVYDLTLGEVKAFFDTANIDNWPVFGMPEPEPEEEEEEEEPEEGLSLADLYEGIDTATILSYEGSNFYAVAVADPERRTGMFLKKFGAFSYHSTMVYDAAAWVKIHNEFCKAVGDPRRAAVIRLDFRSLLTFLEKSVEAHAGAGAEKNLC